MQSITALAHLRACVMFFMDLSEQCGYSIAEQCRLFHSIKPLFANKATLLVVNKIDVVRPENLNPSDQALLKEIMDGENTELVQLSCYTDEGVMDVRNRACDKLLATRVEQKMQSNKISDVLNKLHLAQPQLRDNTDRPAHIPEGALDRIKYDLSDPNRPKLERDLEVENGGAGVYNVDLKKRYMLSNDEWKYDHIPEIMDGKNIADFVDPDIEEQLEALEREEERLVEEGFYDSDGGMSDPEEEAIRSAATEIRKKKQLIINASRDSKGKNRSTLIKKIRAQLSSKDDLKKHMASLDLDPSLALQHNVKSKKRGRSLAGPKRGEDDMDIDDDVTRAASRAPTRDRSMLGVRDVTQKMESVIQGRKSRRRANLMAKAGEADRTIQTKMPKHLFSGKRKGGTTDRR
jgi:nucleolar GTP-binding protein